MVMLSVSGITKHFAGNFAVKNASFAQQTLQKVAVAVETGSGKTTLLKLIAGLLQPDGGEVRFKQRRVEGPLERLIPGHPGIAYLSQHFELRNNYRVEELLEIGNDLTRQEADALYDVCRISHLLPRRTDQLSGGERQRIALARVLTASPQLLLLDEPFSNLDMIHKKIMKSVVEDISEKLGITCLMALHDAPDILSWADSILVMRAGAIIQEGTPEFVYRQPVDEYCGGLFGDYNLLEYKLAEKIAVSHGITKGHRKLMIRPEYIRIGTEPGSIEGIVQKVLFWGNCYTVDVESMQESIRIQTSHGDYTAGETLSFTISAADMCYI